MLTKKTLLCVFAVGLCVSLSGTSLFAQKGVWTDSNDKTLPPSFAIQGEYAGDGIGAQVIDLGGGNVQAVIYQGGLPGAGWNGKTKTLLEGQVAEGGVKLKAATGKKRYLGNAAAEFSATKQFPPAGHDAGAYGTIKGDTLTVTNNKGVSKSLKKTERKSESMGAEPPKSAIVLFNGTNTDAWTGGRLDEKTKLLNTDGKDILTKQKFNNYKMHLEFMLPFRPDARGQGRGNSGFYQVDHYEVQILDSFGLEGLNNECGGVYQKADTLVNMCLPPLTWQTYDVDFKNAVVKDGKVITHATMTLRHNGVIIHKDLEINGKTGGSRNEPLGTPGPIKLQGHGNPLQYRNVWIVEQ